MNPSNKTARRATVFALFQNLPNPFSDSTFITFTIPEGNRWELRIETPEGRTVKRFAGNEGGTLTLSWDGGDEDEQPVADGAYYLRLESGGRSDCRKLMLIR